MNLNDFFFSKPLIRDHILNSNIYFRLIFGLVKTIDSYLLLKISNGGDGCGVEPLPYLYNIYYIN